MNQTLHAVPIEIKFGEIQSNVDIAPVDVQVLRVGTFYDPRYGKVEITKEILAKMKDNYDNKVRRIDLAIDYKHEAEDVAAGWIQNLHLMSDGTELWASVSWTPNGKRVLADKEFRYLSAEFDFNYKDNETQQEYGPTLLGAGLTNRPVIKGMAAAVELQEKYADDPALQACVADWIPKLIAEGKPQDQAIAIAYSKCGGSKMADQTKEIKMSPEELMKKVSELEALVAQLRSEKEDLLGKHEAMMQEKKCAEQTAQFNKLMSEGKVCEAQRESFMSGDTVKFAELAQPVKLETVGTEVTPPAADTREPVEKVMELAQKKLSEKAAKNLGDAVSLVLSENAELRKQYEDSQA